MNKFSSRLNLRWSVIVLSLIRTVIMDQILSFNIEIINTIVYTLKYKS